MRFKTDYIMKNKIFLSNRIVVFTILMCLCCSSKYSKDNHRVTFKLNDSLYVEKYKVFSGGATTSDSYSYYLTDSIHFRKYIGVERHSNDKIFWNDRNPNNIIFYLAYSKLIEEKIINNTTKIGNYYIQELIKEGKFE